VGHAAPDRCRPDAPERRDEATSRRPRLRQL